MYKSYVYIFIFVRNCGGWLSSHKTEFTSNARMQSPQTGRKGRLCVTWIPMSKIRNTNKRQLKYMPIRVASDPARYPAEAGNLCHGADCTYPSGPRVIETEKRYGKKAEQLQDQLLLPTNKCISGAAAVVSVGLRMQKHSSFLSFLHSGVSASHIEGFGSF